MRTQVFAMAGSVLAVALLNGCATFSRNQDNTDYSASTPPAPQQRASENGAIYQEATARPLFEDNKARHVGDLITIVLSESTNASKSATTSTSKESEVDTGTPTILGGGIPRNTSRQLLNNEISSSHEFDGSGESAQSNSLSGTITVTVARVYPNGNLLVRGRKRLVLNQGEEYVRIQGIVRPDDVRSDNSVLSTRVADARITYSGRGTVAESNAMGWLTRFFNSPLWPL